MPSRRRELYTAHWHVVVGIGAVGRRCPQPDIGRPARTRSTSGQKQTCCSRIERPFFVSSNGSQENSSIQSSSTFSIAWRPHRSRIARASSVIFRNLISGSAEDANSCKTERQGRSRGGGSDGPAPFICGNSFRSSGAPQAPRGNEPMPGRKDPRTNCTRASRSS